MTNPVLRRGDEGPDVVRLQGLMNRVGALLVLDGDFGPGTERALKESQGLAGQDPDGVAHAAIWEWLEAQPEPCEHLSCEGVTFIAREEVGSRRFYDRQVARPHFPGEQSGVTIGIGYDLRFQENFDEDWGDLLDPEVMDSLRPHLGVPGSHESVNALASIRIPFTTAWQVFCRSTLPKEIVATRSAYPRLEALSDLCRATLVSLVYNRGAALEGDTRREMKEIALALEEGRLEAVPGLFESMERLWPDSRGLRERRRREADLWRRGLEGGR